MDEVAAPLHILLAEKEGRIGFNTICFKLYQFEGITWWWLFVLEYAVQYVMVEKNIEKGHGLPDFTLGPPLGGGLDEKFQETMEPYP